MNTFIRVKVKLCDVFVRAGELVEENKTDACSCEMKLSGLKLPVLRAENVIFMKVSQ